MLCTIYIYIYIYIYRYIYIYIYRSSCSSRCAITDIQIWCVSDHSVMITDIQIWCQRSFCYDNRHTNLVCQRSLCCDNRHANLVCQRSFFYENRHTSLVCQRLFFYRKESEVESVVRHVSIFYFIIIYLLFTEVLRVVFICGIAVFLCCDVYRVHRVFYSAKSVVCLPYVLSVL